MRKRKPPPVENQRVSGALRKDDLPNQGSKMVDAHPFFSPRSGRQSKAWGVSPRIALAKAIKARGAGGSRIIGLNDKRPAITRFAGSIDILVLVLGLAPQALC
jgi:hypothetical protein